MDKYLLYGDAISFQPREMVQKGVADTVMLEIPICETQGTAYEVMDSGEINFSLYFPNAKSVIVKSPSASCPLTKKDGYWRGAYHMGTGFIPLTLLVDNNAVLSKQLPIGWGGNEPLNYIEVSEIGFDAMTTNVKHGTVAVTYIDSSVTERLERIYVYLPVQYFTEPERKFPVLYLQHGYGENEAVWVNQGKMNFIMDACIADGAAPCVIVMANGMITRRLGDKIIVDYLSFEDFLIHELIPYTEKQYHVYTDKGHRAMAGLSMGSIQTSHIAMRHQELFSYVGLFSGFFSNPFTQEQVHLSEENIRTWQDNIKVFFRAMGDEDMFLPMFHADDSLIEKEGIIQNRKIYHGGHEWKVWRQCLRDFAGMLFI